MGKVLLIAQREFSAFFTTWMGYIIAAAVLFIDGILFNAFAMGSTSKFSADVLGDFFYFSSGMVMVAGILLSMKLLAEEKQTGTIALLYTSPITERQIIYGKYLSAIAFFLVLQVLTLYMPAMIFVNGKVSFGHIVTGYLGVILLGASVLSIGIFASVISPNQLVAGVIGAFITVTLLVLWMLADVVDPPFKSLFGYLALHNVHFSPFMKGIIHIRDIVFYLGITFFFLECSVRSLEARRYRG